LNSIDLTLLNDIVQKVVVKAQRKIISQSFKSGATCSPGDVGSAAFGALI